MNFDVGVLISILGVLVFLTNAITESIKMAFFVQGANILNKIALVIGIILTVLAYLGYSAYMGLSITWYYVLATIILGFVVALIAMVGYDKILQLWMDSVPKNDKIQRR